MDITQLKPFFECKTVAAINRTIGTSFNILEDVAEIKSIVIKEFCDNNGLQICDTDEEMIQASMGGFVSDTADALAGFGVVVTKIDSSDNGGMERINSYQDEKAKSVAAPTDSAKPISGEVTQVVDQSKPIPFKMIPHTTYTWACPYCDKEMGEKDFSFKPLSADPTIVDSEHLWSHNCEQGAGRHIQHPEIDKARAQLAQLKGQFGLGPNNRL